MSVIDAGVLEVRGDGTVWKLRNLNAIPLPEPRRVETKSKRGYLLVRFYRDGKPFLVQAHRLVWHALRGPIPEGLDINHIDGVKTNNHPSNLELATRAENLRHALRTGLRRNRNVALELRPRVLALRAEGLSFSAIASRLGVGLSTAWRAANVGTTQRAAA